jgi:hypothetical protein
MRKAQLVLAICLMTWTNATFAQPNSPKVTVPQRGTLSKTADCNPSTAAGILGTMLGYSNIPEY